MSERIIYEVTVPEDQRSMMDDTPAAYRVTIPDQAGEAACCLVYGKYRSDWQANASCRWLVRHLIEKLKELVELKEWRDSYERRDDPDGTR